MRDLKNRVHDIHYMTCEPKVDGFVKFGVSYWKLDAINFIAIGVNNLFLSIAGQRNRNFCFLMKVFMFLNMRVR